MSQRSFRVRHHECDPYGHLNNVAYLRYVEELEIDLGYAAPAGGLVPGRVDIAYLGQARFGEVADLPQPVDERPRVRDGVGQRIPRRGLRHGGVAPTATTPGPR